MVNASARAGAHRHGVVFYEDDNKFLCEAIVDFCVRALRAADPLVVIATRHHLDQLQAKLRERGLDWEAACAAGVAAEHEAEELMARFCSPTGPDQFKFKAVMEQQLAPWADMSEDHTLRTFGEMVDILCRRGDLEAAAQLEQMWNELARSHRFTLLCAYSMGNLYREVNGSAYRKICDAHDHVLPWTLADATPGLDLRPSAAM
ncbi:MAG: hypothetical protein EXR95_04905 [Gemmatimonadetes bacterium]|nr:hypothetical protein [Gemmatimonadota bacterium]